MKSDKLLDWEKAQKTIEEWAPKCCYTCTNEYGGKCAKHKMEIPMDFMGKEDECHDWTREAF